MLNQKTCVLLVNLGTPDSPKTKDVRKYLTQFLNDSKVIDINFFARIFLVNFIIVPFRARKSAKEYKKLFSVSRGRSPLLVYGLNLQEKLNKIMSKKFDVNFAVRYGNPSLKKELQKIKAKNYKKIILVPLYPQYASSTTESTILQTKKIIKSLKGMPKLEVIEQFYNNDNFINSVCNQINKFNLKIFDHILFSYHGLPERHLEKGHQNNTSCKDHSCETHINDNNQYCYKATCYATTRQIAKVLNLENGSFSSSFQSRLGKSEWIKPYTDNVLVDLAGKGKKKILVASPAFIADCLETTIEISEEYSKLFKQHGGESLKLVPSLNDEDHWVENLQKIILKQNY